MPINFENFAAVFAETLPPDDFAKFEAMLRRKDSARAIFGLAVGAHVACLDPVMFIRRTDKKLISAKAFDAQFNPIVNLIDRVSRKEKDYRDHAAQCALGSLELDRATGVCFEPGAPDWNGTKFNMYKPPTITPLAESPEIFLDHINYLIPDQRERELLLHFLAWMVQHPDKKLMFALLIVGRGGTGKSWFSKLLQVLFGIWNVTVLPKGIAIADRFDASAENKQAIFIDELVPGGKLNLVEAVAPLITQPSVWIERKGIQKFEVANHVNLMGISNYPDAVRLQSREDRRWLIIRATEDVRYTDDEGNATPETIGYYNDLHGITPLDGSVTDEARRILHFLQTRDLAGFDGQSLAPMTDAKIEVAEFSETSIQNQVAAAYRDQSGPFQYTTITVQDVRGMIAHYADQNDTTEQKILGEVTAAMENVGCRRISADQVYLGGKRRERVWAVHKRFLAELQALRASGGPAAIGERYKQERELGELLGYAAE